MRICDGRFSFDKTGEAHKGESQKKDLFTNQSWLWGRVDVPGEGLERLRQ